MQEEPFSHLIAELREISKMLTGLARSLARGSSPEHPGPITEP